MKMSSALFKIWRDLHGNNNALKSFITTKDTAKHFAQTTAIGKRDVKEKIYNFDLRYVIKRYDRNFKSIKPLVTIENEKKQFEEPVIIFPGFEGRLDSVQPLVQNLKRTIHCLQYPFEKSKNSIPEIAATIVQVLKAYALDNERMNILGHSFGGMIAMEVVRKLENEGKDIRLCLTDSTPYAVKVMTSEAFGDIQQSDEFESNLLLNIANCLEFREIILLPNVLAKCADWQEKLGTALPLIV